MRTSPSAKHRTCRSYYSQLPRCLLPIRRVQLNWENASPFDICERNGIARGILETKLLHWMPPIDILICLGDRVERRPIGRSTIDRPAPECRQGSISMHMARISWRRRIVPMGSISPKAKVLRSRPERTPPEPVSCLRCDSSARSLAREWCLANCHWTY